MMTTYVSVPTPPRLPPPPPPLIPLLLPATTIPPAVLPSWLPLLTNAREASSPGANQLPSGAMLIVVPPMLWRAAGPPRPLHSLPPLGACGISWPLLPVPELTAPGMAAKL